MKKNMTVNELKAYAQEMGISLKGLHLKAEIIAAIAAIDAAEVEQERTQQIATRIKKLQENLEDYDVSDDDLLTAVANPSVEPAPVETTPVDPETTKTHELPTWDEELIMLLRLMRPWDGNQGWVRDETGRWCKGPRSVFYVGDKDEYKGKVVAKWNTLFEYVKQWQVKYVNTRKNGVGVDKCSAKSAKIYLDLLFKRGWLEWGTEKKGTMQGHQNEVHCLVIMTTKVNECQKKVLDYWHYETELKKAQKSTEQK